MITPFLYEKHRGKSRSYPECQGEQRHVNGASLFEGAAWFWAFGAWYDKSKVTLSIPHYLHFFSLEYVFIIAPTFLLV
jgi:hypothetical protein